MSKTIVAGLSAFLIAASSPPTRRARRDLHKALDRHKRALRKRASAMRISRLLPIGRLRSSSLL